MASGAVIATEITFEISALTPDSAGATGFLARLYALPAPHPGRETQEIWLESCDDQLEGLRGVLAVRADAGTHPCAGLCRSAEGYRVQLDLSAEVAEALRRRLAEGGRPQLRLLFDVEYHPGYESPGGYSGAYGVRYWDDVRYPDVRADRFEIAGLT